MIDKEIPVLLLTGYLGSGKTTLVNHILKNRKGIRFAVIVNDLGEVNIDADLIQQEGMVSMQDKNLISLQNGCICCTLQNDLIEQIYNLLKTERFDYIVIEASGICNPSPIAQSVSAIPEIGTAYREHGICRMDNIVTIVDVLRMKDEFGSGERLTKQTYGEDDIENLLIQQIEFCNTILLNKVSEIDAEELDKVKKIVRMLQPEAQIIECDYADVPLEQLLYTGRYDFEKVASSAGWVHEFSKIIEDGSGTGAEHTASGHPAHHCHHCHHHEEGEADEYNISTFVYYRRPAFDLSRLDYFINFKWPKNVIRTKGICYFKDERDMSYLFEQSGKQMSISQIGRWYATMPEERLTELIDREPGLAHDWDEKYGDRMQKIVFIGQNLDKEQICRDLDECLEKEDIKQ